MARPGWPGEGIPVLFVYTYAGECGGSQRVAADLGRGFHLVCLAKLSRDEVN
jgi:hypothetical protein